MKQSGRDKDTQYCNPVLLYSESTGVLEGYQPSILWHYIDSKPGNFSYSVVVFTAGFNYNLELQVINSDDRIIFN